MTETLFCAGILRTNRVFFLGANRAGLPRTRVLREGGSAGAVSGRFAFLIGQT